LDISINKIIQEDENIRNNLKIDINGHRTRIIDITNSLNRIIHRFKERKKDPKMTAKT